MNRKIEPMVTEDEIAEVVAGWTSIPLTKLKEEETKRLLRLEEILHQRVISRMNHRRSPGDPPGTGGVEIPNVLLVPSFP